MTWMGGAAATAVISSADSVFQSLLYYCVCPYVNVCVSVIQYKTTRATSSTCSSGVINYLNHDDEFPWIFAAESNLFTAPRTTTGCNSQAYAAVSSEHRICEHALSA
jgi:hypothetical protein